MIKSLIVGLLAGVVFAGAVFASCGHGRTGGGEDEIAVPYGKRTLPPGPNVSIYKANCLGCHDNNFVLQHARTSRSGWQSVVGRMVSQNGARISRANQNLIVDYLLAARGR